MGGISFIDESFCPKKPDHEIFLTPTTVSQLNTQFLGAQQLYKMVGGVHSSGLSDGRSITVMADDIGRHNTFDKLAGKCLLDGINLTSPILLTTGRLSSEMIQKAARMGVSVVISRTSTTTMSIEQAQLWGITLIGYARRDSFNIYTHPDRIVDKLESLESIQNLAST